MHRLTTNDKHFIAELLPQLRNTRKKRGNHMTYLKDFIKQIVDNLDMCNKKDRDALNLMFTFCHGLTTGDGESYLYYFDRAAEEARLAALDAAEEGEVIEEE